MAKLRIPSLQHLARTWKPNSDQVRKGLIGLAENPPRYSYRAMNGYIRDMLMFGQSVDDIEKAIKARVSRATEQKMLLSLLPLLDEHYKNLKTDFVIGVEPRYYSIGRGLRVPFNPPLIYGVGGQLYFPWFSFWKQNPLAGERLSLFVSIVDDLLLQDPDLEGAKFEILDFSAAGSKSRELEVLDAADVPRLNERQKADMLEVFAEGYELALLQLESAVVTSDGERVTKQHDPAQRDLFLLN